MKQFFTTLCLLMGVLSYSQNSTQNQFSLNFLIPSLEYEIAVTKNTTVDAVLGMGFGYHDASYLDNPEYGIYPQFETQYRYYYNLDKRMEKGKKTSENSGNYLAAVGLIASGDPILGDMQLNNDYSGFVGPAWGLQRVYSGNFKLNLTLGLGLGFNNVDNAYLASQISFQLGFKLGKENPERK
ncbi:hypothetical protein SAMN04487764_1391 [Gillisia sp. Hel1_33_143]|uniref:hypothetical protein n=1 Tax=unclassified Gillisia TaxID=2615025 RepID=UPI00087BEBC3|nr:MULTISPECIES: hypothetical protein [unclassified Gillisia]SDS07593.1 hypothetical protein SAMN04487764_1391 [Gillisia sp. Hel1_33_143]